MKGFFSSGTSESHTRVIEYVCTGGFYEWRFNYYKSHKVRDMGQFAVKAQMWVVCWVLVLEVGPWLSILNITVCTCQSQTP